MNLKTCIMKHSTCYEEQSEGTQGGNYYHWRNHEKKTGIVVHSTGANNPWLKRYVQPHETDSDYAKIISDLGKNQYGNDWNHTDRSAGVHAFIGKTASGAIATYQTLPYEYGAWGVGSGSKGSYNYSPQARIQFEICEDDLTDADYFNKVMKEAQEYCAYLCQKFGWGVDQICSHAEAHKAGYGSNHGDIDHWLKKFGKTMRWFRSEVEKILTAAKEPKTIYRVQVGAFRNKAYADAMLQDLKAAGFDGYIKASKE